MAYRISAVNDSIHDHSNKRKRRVLEPGGCTSSNGFIGFPTNSITHPVSSLTHTSKGLGDGLLFPEGLQEDADEKSCHSEGTPGDPGIELEVIVLTLNW